MQRTLERLANTLWKSISLRKIIGWGLIYLGLLEISTIYVAILFEGFNLVGTEVATIVSIIFIASGWRIAGVRLHFPMRTGKIGIASGIVCFVALSIVWFPLLIMLSIFGTIESIFVLISPVIFFGLSYALARGISRNSRRLKLVSIVAIAALLLPGIIIWVNSIINP